MIYAGHLKIDPSIGAYRRDSKELAICKHIEIPRGQRTNDTEGKDEASRQVESHLIDEVNQQSKVFFEGNH